jgi:hypothetical protein
MTKRLRIKDVSRSIDHMSLCDLEADNVAEFRANIEELLANLSEDAKFKLDGAMDEGEWLTITSFRDETDAEMNKRLAREQKKRDKQKCFNDKLARKQMAQELKELARLKKKYPEADPQFPYDTGL